MPRLDPRLLALPLLLLAACSADDDATGNADTADASGDAGAGDTSDTGTDDTGPVTATARFEPDGEGFFRIPWPADGRVLDDGTVDLSDFPRATTGILQTYRRSMENVIRGFSTMPVVYVNLDATLPASALPTPAASLRDDAPVRLVRLEAGSCSGPVPVETRLSTVNDTFLPIHTLQVAPVPGFVLAPGATYALLVSRRWGDGVTLGASPAFAAALDGAGDPAAVAGLAGLAGCARSLGLDPGDLASGTVLTTQDPVSELRRIREFVWNRDKAPTPEVTSFAYSDANSRAGYRTYLGSFRAPIFMQGQTPYTVTGGEIRFDEAGDPVVARFEDVPFSIVIPPDAEGPLPVLVWIDGTGADQTSHIRGRPTQQAISRGFAVANFQPQFHSGRSGDAADEIYSTFNYTNPTAGRNVFRQQVADTSYFVRLLEQSTASLEGIPPLDLSRLVYGGQSQGADVGAIVAGVEPRIVAFGLNGVGSYLSMTIVERTDPVDIARLIKGIVGATGELDRFHPVVQLAQLGADSVDPHNFAASWKGWPGNPGGTSILLTNGYNDHTTPPTSMNALAIAGDVPPLDTPGWDLDPFDVWDRSPEATPLSGNRTSLDGSPRTAGMYMDPDTGHYTIYDDDAVLQVMEEFWLSALDGTPTIGRP